MTPQRLLLVLAQAARRVESLPAGGQPHPVLDPSPVHPAVAAAAVGPQAVRFRNQSAFKRAAELLSIEEDLNEAESALFGLGAALNDAERAHVAARLNAVRKEIQKKKEF